MFSVIAIYLHWIITLSVVACLAAATTRAATASSATRTTPLVVAVSGVHAAASTQRTVRVALSETIVGAVRKTVPFRPVSMLGPAETDQRRIAIDGGLWYEVLEEIVWKAVVRNCIDSTDITHWTKVAQGNGHQASYCNWHCGRYGDCIVVCAGLLIFLWEIRTVVARRCLDMCFGK